MLCAHVVPLDTRAFSSGLLCHSIKHRLSCYLHCSSSSGSAYKINRLSFMATSASLLSASDEEDATESDVSGPISLPILRIMKIYMYTIPSFPVLRGQLRHVNYQMISQGKIGVLDGFMRVPVLGEKLSS